jgi:predicted permease
MNLPPGRVVSSLRQSMRARLPFLTLRGRRGTARRDALALVDSLVRDARFTWRSFRRAPLVAVTVVATVGLGLGLVTAVFTILNAVVFRVDEVRSPHELFAIERRPSAEVAPEAFARPQFDALLREAGVFADAFASLPGEAWIEGRRMEGPLVTGNFFRVLGVTAARGRTLAPADDEPGRPPVIVLSHRTWTLRFASDPGVLDRTIRVNGALFRVVGVMPEGFRGLTWIAPEFWAPLSLAGELRRTAESGQGGAGLRVVGRLAPGLSREQALARLLVWDARQAAGRPRERRASLVLEPSPGTVPLSAEVMLPFVPLFFAFGLVLTIGCANVANLLLARGVARQREIGIRLAIGASRRRIVWQLLTESLLLALVSAALAHGVSRLVLSGADYALMSTFPPDIGHINVAVPPADWRVALFLVGGAMLATLVFALAPALQATRIELLRATRGEVVRDGRPGRARDALVALQVTGSALLFICAAVFLRSSWAAATVESGIRTEGIVTIEVENEARRAAVLNVLNGGPLVASVAASWPAFAGGLGRLPAFASSTGGGSGSDGRSPVTYQLVSPEYFEVLGIDLVRGRGFTPAERSEDASVAVVSETVARQLWPGVDAIGQVLRIEPNLRSQTATPDDPRLRARTVVVVGIGRDVAGFRLGSLRLGGAGVYLPTGTEAAGTALTVQVRGEAERARRALVDRLAAIDPGMGRVRTLQTVARAEAYLLGIPFWLTVVLGGLGLLLTLTGLFSVLSFLVEQRAREIGVRMALGATRGSIAALVLSQCARPVGAGLLVGGGLTAGLGAVLLATPAAEQIGSSVQLFDPLAYAAGLVWIVAACTGAALVPALRAAWIDPVGALRQE